MIHPFPFFSLVFVIPHGLIENCLLIHQKSVKKRERMEKNEIETCYIKKECRIQVSPDKYNVVRVGSL